MEIPRIAELLNDGSSANVNSIQEGEREEIDTAKAEMMDLGYIAEPPDKAALNYLLGRAANPVAQIAESLKTIAGAIRGGKLHVSETQGMN